MKIKTKFKINELVIRKFCSNTKDFIYAYEIININTETCCVGTQVFYTCRQITGQKYFESMKLDYWLIGCGISRTDNNMGLMKFREDELIEITKEMKEIIENPDNIKI